MLTFEFWMLVVLGVVFLFLALTRWRRGQRRRSLADRWWSLLHVALALTAGFLAVDQLATNSLTSEPWWALQTAALLVATCALVVAVVFSIQENRPGAGVHRYRS
jgi:quinol-cytochrome oxidoreductase complex cytochrome b subunit